MERNNYNNIIARIVVGVITLHIEGIEARFFSSNIPNLEANLSRMFGED